uniref:Plasmodium variant antigen protein Cir/Yir/Bir n=1 Tax=Parastrongyloides trichosuri TaxID=131310 RepID=A0A0N4ZPH2_PARTI
MMKYFNVQFLLIFLIHLSIEQEHPPVVNPQGLNNYKIVIHSVNNTHLTSDVTEAEAKKKVDDLEKELDKINAKYMKKYREKIKLRNNETSQSPTPEPSTPEPSIPEPASPESETPEPPSPESETPEPPSPESPEESPIPETQTEE